MHSFERQHFATDRTLEFFTESELRTQIGCARDLWPLAIAKELIDNALDACESAAGAAPEIIVTLEEDVLTVADNGPGIPDAVIERSLDYLVRVSDKRHYVAPTRGQLGNALKCIWAAPFVVNGKQGLVEVDTCGTRHLINVELDLLAQKPRLEHGRWPGSVKNGTSFKIHWNGIVAQNHPTGANFTAAAASALRSGNF
jgi:DNA topoisomerase VI subunit B